MARIVCTVDDLHKFKDYYIARDVYDPENGRMLLNVNCQISDNIINGLKSRGIDSIYISDEKVFERLADEESEMQGGIVEIRQTKKQLKSVFEEVSSTVLNQSKLGRSKGISISTEMMDKIEESIEKMVDAVMRNPTAALYLGAMNDEDQYILRHSANIAYLALCLGIQSRVMRDILRDKEKGVGRFSATPLIVPENMVPLGLACLLHDIGKVLLIEVINANKTYAKEDKAWERIKAHPKVGYDILFGKNIDSQSLLGIKYHHENFDGSGYPYGVKGYKIHVYSRIIRILDSFDAGTSKDRPGKEPKLIKDVLQELREGSGKLYDPDIVDCFLSFIEGTK